MRDLPFDSCVGVADVAWFTITYGRGTAVEGPGCGGVTEEIRT